MATGPIAIGDAERNRPRKPRAGAGHGSDDRRVVARRLSTTLPTEPDAVDDVESGRDEQEEDDCDIVH